MDSLTEDLKERDPRLSCLVYAQKDLVSYFIFKMSKCQNENKGSSPRLLPEIFTSRDKDRPSLSTVCNSRG